MAVTVRVPAGADLPAEVMAEATQVTAVAVCLKLAVVVLVAVLVAAAAVVAAKAEQAATMQQRVADKSAVYGQVAQYPEALVVAVMPAVERMRTHRDRAIRAYVPGVMAETRAVASLSPEVPMTTTVPPSFVMHVVAPTVPAAVHIPAPAVASPVIVHAVAPVASSVRSTAVVLSLDMLSAVSATTVSVSAPMLCHRRCGNQAHEAQEYQKSADSHKLSFSSGVPL